MIWNVELEFVLVKEMSMTDDGTKANDTFLTIVETCKKLGVNPFQYIMAKIKKLINLNHWLKLSDKNTLNHV